MKNYFEVLDIDEQAGQQDIKRAYKRMLTKYPAEKFPEKNRDIEEAYEALSNPGKRHSYVEFHRMSSASKQAYLDARDAMDRGEYAKAAKTLETAIRHEEHAVHLKYVLGIAYMNLDKPSRAVRMLEPVRDEFPDDIELNIKIIQACLDAKEYDKALAWAKEANDIGKDNFVLLGLLADSYQLMKRYDEALAVLKEAFGNPAFADRQFVICAKTAFILFLNEDYADSLEWMDKLAALKSGEMEKAASVEMFVVMLDSFIEKHMLLEACRCASAILELVPDRGDIARIKRGIEVIMSIEPEVDRFDRDEFIPDLLKMYVASGINSLETEELTEEEQVAYMILIEYQLLREFSAYLIAARYMKTHYPALYELKADFLDAFQDSRERKKLINKNKVLFCRYQDIIAQMMEEYGDGDDWDDDEYWDDEDEDSWDDDEYWVDLDDKLDEGNWDDDEYWDEGDDEGGWDDDEYWDDADGWDDEDS